MREKGLCGPFFCRQMELHTVIKLPVAGDVRAVTPGLSPVS